jgi:uncharacterized protein (UPF0332 family)
MVFDRLTQLGYTELRHRRFFLALLMPQAGLDIMTHEIEIRQYIARALAALKQSGDNLELDYYDVAASRAYYAMFYATSGLLTSNGISRSKHSGVRAAFGEYFVKTGIFSPTYAKMLARAFELRLDSDYDVTGSVGRREAEETLKDARQFVKRVAQFLRESEGLGELIGEE